MTVAAIITVTTITVVEMITEITVIITTVITIAGETMTAMQITAATDDQITITAMTETMTETMTATMTVMQITAATDVRIIMIIVVEIITVVITTDAVEIIIVTEKRFWSALKRPRVDLMESNRNRKIPENVIKSLRIRAHIRNQQKKK